jgi:hypothetical protein
MGKEQFDYIESRIKEAAENSEPAFDEFAWADMEARLNDEGNGRHRFVWWWFLLVLLFIGVGGIYLFLGNQNIKTEFAQTAEQNVATNKLVQQKNVGSATSPMNNERGNNKTGEDTDGNTVSGQPIKKAVNADNDIAHENIKVNSEKIKHVQNGEVSAKITAGQLADTGEEAGGTDSSHFISDTAATDKTLVDSGAVALSDTAAIKGSSQISIAANLPDSNKTAKVNKEIPSRFYFIAAVAADVASVKFMSFQNSQVTPKFGIGIGYQFNKKISLQTGFYAGRKKYVAGPEDYNAKYGSYWDMVQIIEVDASCLVYDIPLSFRYNFLQKPTTTYYAIAGVSSFVMKKEDYNYSYLYYNIPHESAWTYSGNKHFFSVFNISVGIEKKISPDFSLLLEPIISIPISGVGEGRVKLYSAALQAGIKYTPKRKHK